MPTRRRVSPMRLWLLLLLLACSAIANAQPEVVGIKRITLTVADTARSEAFYRDGLGFETVAVQEIDDPAMAHLLGVEDARIHSIVMRLGDEEVELQQYAAPGKRYPNDNRSPDLWFQHFAIIVSDMPRAYEHLRKAVSFVPISRGGPQTLPPENGHVRAFKFRDPDGHPLELLYFPPGVGRPQWSVDAGAPLFLGIDHSAISVSSTPASVHFYRDLLGLHSTYAITNRGPTQENLDGTFNAVVEITGLRGTSDAGPGVEFLEYRTPPVARPAPPDTASNDIVHARLGFSVRELNDLAEQLYLARVPFISPGVVKLDRATYGYEKAALVRDPDGHAILLVE